MSESRAQIDSGGEHGKMRRGELRRQTRARRAARRERMLRCDAMDLDKLGAFLGFLNLIKRGAI